ncbi:MAG: DUF3526 domain-containing protein [Gemmatimonadales bacterium]|nr:MAG: DUF3526 domain-containing protein [Gemmatimonadales bacterium]
MGLMNHAVRHEVRSLLADRIVWVAVLALLVLSGYATWVGVQTAEERAQQVVAAQEEERERYEALREVMVEVEAGNASLSPFQDPTRPYVAGRNRGRKFATLPPAPFQAAAVGQSDLIPPVVAVTLDDADLRGAQEEIENPVHLLAGPLDLAFLVTFLLPLLALALSFDMVSREREQGTLALLLSQPNSPRRILAAKAGVRWLLLLLATVGGTGAALLLLGTEVSVTHMAAWAGVVALYLAFWIGLAALVNATGRDSARNAVVLAFLWLVFVIVIPAGVQISAGLLHPVPSRAELVALEREEVRQVQEEAASVLARYYDDHPELLPEGTVDEVDFQTRAFAVNREVAERLGPVRATYRESLESQQEWIRGLRWSSPTILAYELLVELAGTGDGRIRSFEDQVEAFHQEWLEYFGPRIYADQRLVPADMDAFPLWEFRERGGRETARALLPGYLGLLLLSALVAGVVMRLFRPGPGQRWGP